MSAGANSRKSHVFSPVAMAQTVQRDEAEQQTVWRDPLLGHLLQLPLRLRAQPALEEAAREVAEAASAPELVFAIAARRTATCKQVVWHPEYRRNTSSGSGDAIPGCW